MIPRPMPHNERYGTAAQSGHSKCWLRRDGRRRYLSFERPSKGSRGKVDNVGLRELVAEQRVTQPGRAEREGRGRPAKGTRATAASGRQGAKRLGCCSSEPRKERCGHPSPDRSSRGKVAGRNRTLGEGEGSVGSSVATGARSMRMQRKLSFLKCVSPARP
jgi:hypothetical protein